MKYFVIVLLLCISTQPGMAADKKVEDTPKINWDQYRCPAFKEFVTAFNYLKDKKEFVLPPSEAQRIAEQVAAGCESAAQRFIHTTDILTKTSLASRDAIKTGIEMANASQEEADAFLTVFKTAFLESRLDMDVWSALKMARSLSVELKVNRKQATEDFQQLVNFCVSSKGLALPRPQCAPFAAKIARASERSENASAATAFEELFQFLTRNEDGPRLTSFEAARIGEEVILVAPFAQKNFIDAYRFATAKTGLNKSRDQAILFATSIAKSTVNKEITRK